MARISILIAFLPHLLYAMVQSRQSLCSQYFTYMTKPGITDMLGQIEITPPSANDMFYLKVALSTTTELSQVVRLELARSIKESVRHVLQGRPLLYHVYHPMNEQIPSLSAIWFNSQRYCPNPEVSENITANVELGHILSAPNGEPLVYGPWQEISQLYHRNSSSYRIDNPNYDRLNHSLNTECGITSYYTNDTNCLMSDGETTLPGQWPWVAAIYHYNTDNENKYRFTCTGSILTTRHVITSGGCVSMRRRGSRKYELINPQWVYVRCGQLNSHEWYGNHTGIINRVVVDYKLSPGKITKLVKLAILILKTAVQYNAFIKPICLWSSSTTLQDTVNMTGYIVGWGGEFIWDSSGFGDWRWYTGELRMAKVPIMNLSEKTFGDEDIMYNEHPNGPCYSDDGSGFMVFNTITGRYELRAIKLFCTPRVTEFNDVSKHISWIRQQISLT